MSNPVHYKNCPVCGSSDISNCFAVKDYTVSGERFSIYQCGTCTVRFTQDVPNEVDIQPYYSSENYISHSNTSKGLINRVYQYVRSRTVKRKKRLVSQLTGLQTGSILDLGSGTGTFANTMKKAGWSVKGLEPDATARKVALDRYQLVLGEMSEFMQLTPGSFDAITLWHVLEHVHVLHAYMKQLQYLLKDKGRLIIAVPNYTSRDASIYKEFWAAYDTPRHLYHFSPQSMEVLINLHGMELLQAKPMWYDSFYISLLSSKYKNGKTRIMAALWNGIRSNINAMKNVKKCSSVIYVIGKKNA